jgi:hypothetical protein
MSTRYDTEQFELFPSVRVQKPQPGEIVRILHYVNGRGNKMMPGERQWRVISWPLYFLLSGEDPEGWMDEEGEDWEKQAPNKEELPLIAVEGLRTRDVNLWASLRKSDFLSYQVLQIQPAWMVTRGY